MRWYASDSPQRTQRAQTNPSAKEKIEEKGKKCVRYGVAGSSARMRASVVVKRVASESEKIRGGRSLMTL